MTDRTHFDVIRTTSDPVAALDQIQAYVREIEKANNEDARFIKETAGTAWAENLGRLGPITDRDRTVAVETAAVTADLVLHWTSQGATPREALSTAHTALSYYLYSREGAGQ